MNKLILTTAMGLAILATPAIAADGTTTTGSGTFSNQRMLPGGYNSRSYDNSAPATADPQLGPQGGSGEGDGGASGGDGAGAGGGDGAGAGAGGDGAGGSGGAGGGGAGGGGAGGAGGS